MKRAFCKGELIDLNNNEELFANIRVSVYRFGATCISCGQKVKFCSGPKKGSYFSHLKQNKNCKYYHPSNSRRSNAKCVPLSPMMANAVEPFTKVLKRSPSASEMNQIYNWLYHDNYRISEIAGILLEIQDEENEIPKDLFKKMDSRLFAVTRSKKPNPYFAGSYSN